VNMKASIPIKAGTALALAGLVWANSAMAQDSSLVGQDRPADNAASCNELNWHREFVTSYPWASEACREVVTVNGAKWARFEGEFQGINDDGSFDAEFMSRADRNLGSVTLMPTSGQQARLDNRQVAFTDLDQGQILSFYVPEGAVGFAVEPGAPNSQFVRVVDTSEDSPGSTMLAQADTDRNANRDMLDSELPNTAGPLPLIALGGLLSLFGGLGLSIRRKLSKRTV